MNRGITRVATFALVLLVALIVGTTYWQVWAASSLAERQDNAIQAVAQFTIKRGKILGSHAKTIYATNVRRKVKGETFYFRKYPNRGMLAQTVGYSTQVRNRTGLEQSLNDYLTGTNSNLNTVLRTNARPAQGRDDHREQRLPHGRPGRPADRAGRARAPSAAPYSRMEPSTGKVLVLASSPTYNLNLAENRIHRRSAGSRPTAGPASPLVNRGNGALFPPGSSFKVVTAAAALDTGIYTPESLFYDPGYCIEYGKQVRQRRRPGEPGAVRDAQPLQRARALGQLGLLQDRHPRSGRRGSSTTPSASASTRCPPLETPENERAISGLYRNGQLFYPSNNSQVDPGRLAFGQERMIVTPEQMAMVAAGVANKGVVMRPYVVDRIEQPNGSLVTRTSPKIAEPRDQAADRRGAQLDDAGRRDRRHRSRRRRSRAWRWPARREPRRPDNSGINTTWFIAFAPADHPRVAIAVVLQNQTGFGGSTAAPSRKP